jgi:hypothetical protein
MFLPDVFLQSARTAKRPRGEWSFTFQAVLHGVVKEVVGHGVIISDAAPLNFLDVFCLQCLLWLLFFHRFTLLA